MTENTVHDNVTKRRLKKVARVLGVVAMLFLYGMGSTQTGYLHQLLHPEEVAALHSAAQEQDPCHRSLHHGGDMGCRHEFHLVKLHSCGICYTLTNSDIDLFQTVPTVFVLSGTSSPSESKNQCTNTGTDSPLTRGPPVQLRA